MITDKALKLLKEDISEYPKINELYSFLENEPPENKRALASNWLQDDDNRQQFSQEIQKAISAGIIMSTFNLNKAMSELNGDTSNISNESNHIIIWPANPFLPGIGIKEAEAAEVIINKYNVSSSKIFTYCPNNGETGMWGLSSVSQFGHHKSCKSNLLKGSQHNDDVITSPESLALTLLESYSNRQIKESALKEDDKGQLTNAKIDIEWSEPIHVHCNQIVAKDFHGLAKILQERSGTSYDNNGNIVSNIKIVIDADLPDNSQALNYGIKIYNDISKYMDSGYKPGKQEAYEEENSETPEKASWSWEEVKRNKAAQQYITAVFTDIKSCKNRVLQKDGPAKKAKDMCKAVFDEFTKQWGTFAGAAFKSAIQLTGFGFVASILQKGLEELNKNKDNKDEEFFKQFFNSKYSETLKQCAGDMNNFIEWGE